ncbi:MAG: phage holin family protein [Candidatus Methanofastidiosa archaeon]|nr:phage holin family protein [Candidatus Methanofastidiosa archaeon]
MIETVPLNKLIELLIKYIGVYIKQGASDAIEEAIKEPMAKLSKILFLTIGSAILAFSGLVALFISLVFFLKNILGSYMMAFLVVGMILVIIGAILGYGGYTYGRKDRKTRH